MARKVKVGSTTRRRLGRATVADVLDRLSPAFCRACDWHFDDERLSLVIDRNADLAMATLHHDRCTAPGWTDRTRPMEALPRTAGYMWMSPVTPVFVVNPSGEAVLLRKAGDQWLTVGSLDDLFAAGLTADIDQVPDVPDLVATVDADDLTVHLDGRYWWSTKLGPSVAAAIDLDPTVLVVVSNHLTPGPELTRELVMASPYPVAFGRTRVRFTPEAQHLRMGDVDHKVRAEAISSHADAAVRVFGLEIDERAVLAACDGDPGPIERLTGRRQVLAVLTVAQVYAGEPVHVVVADNDTVARFEEVRDALGGDVVIGTVEQLGESFGQARLAITVDVHRRSDLYRRMLTVSNSRVAEHLRSAPVVDRLLRNRMVVVNGDINDEVANQVTAQLVLLDSEDPAVDITMYINSSGGSVVAAFAILDTIELISAPVVTCVVGLAAGTAPRHLRRPGKAARCAEGEPGSRDAGVETHHRPDPAGDVREMDRNDHGPDRHGHGSAGLPSPCRRRAEAVIPGIRGSRVRTRRRGCRSLSLSTHSGLHQQ
ncbi:hypothetical protein GCM10029964_057060 [Kibdelosporangium lantanae]